MPYVLEYTSRHYQRRRTRHRAEAFVFAFLLVLGVLVGAWASAVAKRPTFRQIVKDGYIDDESGKEIRPYQTLAGEVFMLDKRWKETVARQAELMPYLRLTWSEVPVTNLVASVTDLLLACDIPPLEPQGFSVRMNDKPEDWTGPNSAFVNGLVVSIRWNTVAAHDEDTAANACSALSNLFSLASSPIVSTNAVVRKVDFPEGNRAGLEVVSEYAFPTIRRMPVSKNLSKAVEGLHAFHKAAVAMRIYAKKDSSKKNRPKKGASKKDLPQKDLSMKPTLQDAFDMLKDPGSRSSRFEDAMDPGDWIASANFKNWTTALGEPARQVVEEWNRRVQGRYPWERGFQNRLMSSKNHYYNPKNLQEFCDKLPKPSDLDEIANAFVEKCHGFTNALNNADLSQFDLNEFDRAEIHATTNLLTEAWGTPLVPTNGILGIALPGESLVLHHPRSKHGDAIGIRLSIPGTSDTSNRYAFVEWNYDYSSTNALASLPDFAAGLAGFLSCGPGYAPAAVDVTLQDQDRRHATHVAVSGLLPVRLLPVRSSSED